MPSREFFARMRPEFAAQAGFARDSEGRQADVARLLAKAEYECYQLRRELTGHMEGVTVPVPAAGQVALALAADEPTAGAEPARAA